MTLTDEQLLKTLRTQPGTVSELADELGLHLNTLGTRVLNLTGQYPGAYRRDHGWVTPYLGPRQTAWMVRWYRSHPEVSAGDIAREWHCSREIARQVLLDAGIPLRFEGSALSLDEDQVADVVRRYRAGESARSICRTYGVHESSIRNLLEEEGIDRRAPRDAGWQARYGTRRREIGPVPADLAAQVAEQYRAGATFAALEAEHHYYYVDLRAALVAQGVEIRRPLNRDFRKIKI